MAGKKTEQDNRPHGKCSGGASFNCHRIEHDKSLKWPDIFCYRCNARMGCGQCCERTSELLCLNCHNWATKSALRHHGNICPNSKVPNVRTDNGWITMNGRSVNVERIIESAQPAVRVLPAHDPRIDQSFLDESRDLARIEERNKVRQKLMEQAKEIDD